MANKTVIESTTEQYILPILEKKGFSLYDVEYVKEGSDMYLRAYIDKPGGITIDDCVEVSREMNEILDSKDYVDEEYIFEVSSPGLGRKLTKDKHLQNSIGMDIEMKSYKPIDGSKEFSGKLISFDKDSLTVEIDGAQKVFDRKDISMIKLALDF